MPRRCIIAGNWKMNLLPAQAEQLVWDLSQGYEPKAHLEVVIMPQPALVGLAADWVGGTGIQLGAQNCSDQIKGAFTGETSPQLLKMLGCRFCIVGHSERREIFGETDQQIAAKAKSLISLSITPVVCVGESLAEREAGQHFDKISNQIKALYQGLEKVDYASVVLAYEPIWAIGTGKTATAAQANEMHQFIRNRVKEQAGEALANSTSILYGGSAKASNAAELLGQPEVDGLLVGGASLAAEDFINIINAHQV